MKEIVSACEAGINEAHTIFLDILHSTFMQYSNVNEVARAYGDPEQAMRAIEILTQMIFEQRHYISLLSARRGALNLVEKFYAKTVLVHRPKKRIPSIPRAVLCLLIDLIAAYMRVLVCAKKDNLPGINAIFTNLVNKFEEVHAFASVRRELNGINKAYIDIIGVRIST